MRSILRALIVFGLVTAMAGGVWAECATEELTPEQQACCAARGHNCGAPSAEMGCCPDEPPPQDRLQAVAAKSDLIAPALVTGPLALTPEPHVRLAAAAAASFGRETLKLPDRPTHLFLSVFLI